MLYHKKAAPAAAANCTPRCSLASLPKTPRRLLIAQYGIQPFYRRSFLKKQGYWPEGK